MAETESQAVKRKRIATACKTCQKKKIKCDGNKPCTYCMTHKIDCIFTQMRQRGGSRRGAKYMDALENRLSTMESLLNGSGLLPDKNIQSTAPPTLDDPMLELPATTSISPVPEAITPPDSSNYDALPTLEDSASQQSFHASPGLSERQQSRILDHERDGNESLNSHPRSHSHSNGMDSIPNNLEASTYSTDSFDPTPTGGLPCIGPAAGFSIFSPKGIQWVIDKTGNTTFKDAMTAAARDENTMDYWTSDTFSCVFTRRVFRQLPPKEETVIIVEKFFRDFNSVCPLFSQPVFMALVERQYSSNPYDGVGWWASLNCVIAITLMLQALDNAPPAVAERSRDYLRNCLAVLTELTIRSTDLFGVQALLSIALLLQGTPDPRPVAFLIASAMRLSHTLGLHKKESLYGLDPIEAEQRKRVFWIAYRIDKDLCIRSGLPLIQDEDDMSLDLPSEDPADGLGNMILPDGQGKINIFRIMAEFATIQAKVHKQLYSANVSKQSDEDLLITIGELDHLLEEWKESIPVDLDQPEYEIRTANSAPQILHLIVLHFSYYNCLHTIHRTSIQHSYWTSRPNAIQGFEAVPLNPRVFQSAALCSSSARASIRLIKYIPTQDIGFVWRVLYFPVSAFITLFASILQTPTDSRARADLRLMRSLVDFLSRLQHEDSHELKRIFRVCSEFERTAREVVERAEKYKSKDARQGRKWSSQELEQAKFGRNVPLTPLTAGGMGEQFSPPLYGRAGNQSYSSALDDSLGTNFNAFPGLMAEIQPMFPNGLTMPWNGNTFHGSFGPESFPSNGPYGFDVGMNG